MMFFELDEGDVTLADIKRITQGLLHNKYVFSQLTPAQYADLAYIVTPTLAADHNEANIRTRWQKVLAEFTINDRDGHPMRFYQDHHHRIFFGDAEGWQAAQAFVNEQHNAILSDSLHPAHPPEH